MYKFVAWRAIIEKNFCALTPVRNVKDSLDLQRGMSRARGFPKNATFSMDPNYPKAIGLADNVLNLNDLVVVSKRLKEFLEVEQLKNNEFLQVSIMNHKKQIINKEYFIVNQYHLQECIDLKASGVEWNPIDPKLITGWTKLVIDEGKIEEGIKMFRPKHLPMKVFVDRRLAEKIKKAGFTGVGFKEIPNLDI